LQIRRLRIMRPSLIISRLMSLGGEQPLRHNPKPH
jgi:hypothetical protein